MIYIGIDPGASGGIAFCHDGVITAFAMPDTEQDVSSKLRGLADCEFLTGPRAMIEKLAPMPSFVKDGKMIGRGSISSFKIGQSYGFLRGCLVSLGISFDEVLAREWQSKLGCISSRGTTYTEKKNFNKQKAQQLFPHIKVTHAIADALLIMEYLRRREIGNQQVLG